MTSIFKKYKTFMFIFLGVSILIFIGIYTLLQPQKTLPIFTPRDVNPQLVDSTIQHVGYNHRIADFKFTNQNGKIITQDDYKDKIYVAEFFFTTCPTICPIMTENMVWLQDKIIDMPDVLLLSHSVTPDIDSVPVLKKYAIEKGVLDRKWNLVTGDKKDIYYIARKSYLAVETGKPEELYDMVHTENFVLIDKKGRIRGFYDGTNLDKPTDDGTKNVTQLLEDIKWLSEIEK
ncbi:SCO family protein [Flavobacterium gelidilacus]|uniref:SCO family protein n=1 Tax=Flavobacterium gelidilacus TaxID=206041 RepID=UPI0003FE63F7|nr:SCO family protein [Flavobacterium gelidilacus]